MPKPADMSLILFEALKASGYSGGVPEFRNLKNFNPELAVLSSILFALVMLGISAREFRTTDY